MRLLRSIGVATPAVALLFCLLWPAHAASQRGSNRPMPLVYQCKWPGGCWYWYEAKPGPGRWLLARPGDLYINGEGNRYLPRDSGFWSVGRGASRRPNGVGVPQSPRLPQGKYK